MSALRRSFALLALLILASTGPARAADPLPPPPNAAVARLLGQYGAPDFILTVYEEDGRLYADAPTIHRSPLACVRSVCRAEFQGDELVRLTFEIRSDRAVAATLMGRRLPRRDFGAEQVAAIRAKVKADPATLRAAALAARPPQETGKRPADLVALTGIDPRIRLDIRYATANNSWGFPLYEREGAYMQRPAAEALGRAQAALAAQGYGLLIHDAYRPWFVTKIFWDATPPEDHVFVADPAEGSKHNRGCAVDLTLYDLKTGKPVVMTGRYDEMSTRSYADFVGGTSRQRALRAVLRAAMEAQGFTVYPQEWWHFDYKDWASYPIGAVTFTELEARR
jgi:D-alanyl-D-alanine dipeptidase